MVTATSLESESLRRLIDRLQDAGCGKYVELPQIAVMGDTSCGKSSLLSALSGIEFPSSEKLTTRCPTQIIMTNNSKELNASFSASVRLRRYGNQDNGAENTDVEKQLGDISEITAAIEELTQKLVDEGQNISDDSIVISAKGPDLPNLTIIDLPGLVRTVKDGEDESMIERIRSLVKRYLEQSRTIILSVVPANVDIHNTEILQMAKEVDPEGDRTISVITKPDLVDKGAEDSVIQLLMNKTKKLKLFYHCVKCRGQKQLNKGTSLETGIEHERDFFRTIEPWKDVPEDLVGIVNLRWKLAELMEARIKESMPSVQREIKSKLKTATKEIEKLGSPLNDSFSRRKYFSDILDKQHRMMECMIKGNYDRDPNFFLSEKGDESIKKLRSALHKLDDEFSEAITQITIKIFANEMEAGDPVSILIDGIWSKSTFKMGDKSGDMYKVYDDDKKERQKRDFEIRPCISELKKRISDNRGDEITFFPSYSVFVSLVQERINEFEGPMLKLLDDYYSKCYAAFKLAIDFNAGNPKVRAYLESQVLDFLQEIKSICCEKLMEKFSQELRPSTLNPYLYEIFNEMKDHYVLSSLNHLEEDENGKICKQSVLGILKNRGIGSSSYIDNQIFIEDQQALETLMASSAYLKVARQRFIDDIPMILNNHFLVPVVNEIRSVRMQKSDAELEKLLKPSNESINNRKKWEDQVASLTAANELIMSELFGMTSR